MKDAAGEANDGKDEEELEAIDDVVAYLRGGYVETANEGYRQTEDGGAAEDGVDADEEAGGDAPGELFRRCSHAQERKNGQGDAAVDPVVMNGRWDFVGGCGVGLARVHC